MAKSRRQSNENLETSLANLGQTALIHMVKNGAFSISAGASGSVISFNSSVANKKITVSGSAINFEETGIYQVFVSYRSTTDTWTKHSIRDTLGNVAGESALGGSGLNYSPIRGFLCTISDISLAYNINIYAELGDTIILPNPATPPNFGTTTRTMDVIITKISEI